VLPLLLQVHSLNTGSSLTFFFCAPTFLGTGSSRAAFFIAGAVPEYSFFAYFLFLHAQKKKQKKGAPSPNSGQKTPFAL